MLSPVWHNLVLIHHKPIFMQHTTSLGTFLVLLTIACAMMVLQTLDFMVTLIQIGLKIGMNASQWEPMSSCLQMVQSLGVPGSNELFHSPLLKLNTSRFPKPQLRLPGITLSLMNSPSPAPLPSLFMAITKALLTSPTIPSLVVV